MAIPNDKWNSVPLTWTMQFGIFKGMALTDVPTRYLKELLDTNSGAYIKGFQQAAKHEYDRRMKAEVVHENGVGIGHEPNYDDPSVIVQKFREAVRRGGSWNIGVDLGGKDYTAGAYTNAPQNHTVEDRLKRKSAEFESAKNVCQNCMGTGKRVNALDAYGFCNECMDGVKQRNDYLHKQVEELKAAKRSAQDRQRHAEAEAYNAKMRAETTQQSRRSGERFPGSSVFDELFGNGTPKADACITKQHVLDMVKECRRLIAKKYHPDLNKDNPTVATDKLKEYNAACDWLEKCAERLTK